MQEKKIQFFYKLKMVHQKAKNDSLEDSERLWVFIIDMNVYKQILPWKLPEVIIEDKALN